MRHLVFLLTLTIPFSICTNLFAQKSQNSTDPSVEANFAGSAQKTFLDAQTHYKHNPTNAEVAWRFAPATFAWAEYATNSAQPAELAEKGIVASRNAVAGPPPSVARPYC